ncbi:MAG: PTS sugar transporter subunit IIC [Desulfoplanes sp.]
MPSNPLHTIHIRDYIILMLNGMAHGLFASLIIGLILKQIGHLMGFPLLIQFGQIAQYMMGPAIGVGVAASLGTGQKSPLGMYASIITGAIGAGTVVFHGGTAGLTIGEPVGALVAAWAGAEFAKLISGKTKIDIVLVPAGTILAGGLAGHLAGPFVVQMMTWLGDLINVATQLHPLPMGIVVAVLMGIFLTLPISSAAIAISLGLHGLAAGAATVGCAAQMVGFAVMSYRENRISGLIAQGLGTSMLQIPNIIKNPRIWLPPIITSALLGPLATTVFHMTNTKIGAGMGTSGLVGQFATLDAMGQAGWLGIILLHFVLPAILCLIIAEYMRKKGWIAFGDMKLP